MQDFFEDHDNFSIENEEKDRFTIDNDNLADWTIRKLKDEKADFERIKEIALSQIDEINEKLKKAADKYEHAEQFFTAKLAQYFETVPHKVSKTQEKYQLLSGTLKLKKGAQTIVRNNDDELLSWIKNAGCNEYIVTTEKPAWGEFKKRLRVVDGIVIDNESGEVVQGLTIEDKPDTFQVDF